jgi:hypothetical protein
MISIFRQYKIKEDVILCAVLYPWMVTFATGDSYLQLLTNETHSICTSDYMVPLSVKGKVIPMKVYGGVDV